MAVKNMRHGRLMASVCGAKARNEARSSLTGGIDSIEISGNESTVEVKSACINVISN
jgi:hypothetical protein